MTKILKTREREGKEEIHKELDEIDSTLISINGKLRKLKGEFNKVRDRSLIAQLNRNLEWASNKILLLKGRITTYDLGGNLFMDKEYLQFHFRRLPRSVSRNLEYIPLRETKYSGRKFSKFMDKELGAKAHVAMDGNKIIISSVLIPRNKKNLIVYE